MGGSFLYIDILLRTVVWCFWFKLFKTSHISNHRRVDVYEFFDNPYSLVAIFWGVSLIILVFRLPFSAVTRLRLRNYIFGIVGLALTFFLFSFTGWIVDLESAINSGGLPFAIYTLSYVAWAVAIVSFGVLSLCVAFFTLLVTLRSWAFPDRLQSRPFQGS